MKATAPPIKRMLRVMAVMVPMSSTGHTSCAIMEQGIITQPTAMEAMVVRPQRVERLCGVPTEMAPVPEE